MRVWSLGQEDPLEEKTATHSSILAWKNPMDRGTWQATVHVVTKSQTQQRDWACTHTLHSWEGFSNFLQSQKEEFYDWLARSVIGKEEGSDDTHTMFVSSLQVICPSVDLLSLSVVCDSLLQFQGCLSLCFGYSAEPLLYFNVPFSNSDLQNHSKESSLPKDKQTRDYFSGQYTR